MFLATNLLSDSQYQDANAGGLSNSYAHCARIASIGDITSTKSDSFISDINLKESQQVVAWSLLHFLHD